MTDKGISVTADKNSQQHQTNTMEAYLRIYMDLTGHQNNFLFCSPEEKMKLGSIIKTETSVLPLAGFLEFEEL